MFIQDRPTRLASNVSGYCRQINNYMSVVLTSILANQEPPISGSCKVTLYHPKILLKNLPTPRATLLTNLTTAGDRTIRMIQQANWDYLAQPWQWPWQPQLQSPWKSGQYPQGDQLFRQLQARHIASTSSATNIGDIDGPHSLINTWKTAWSCGVLTVEVTSLFRSPRRRSMLLLLSFK